MGAANRGSKKVKLPQLPPKADSGAIITHNMSYDAEKGFTSCGVDPSRAAFLDDLKAHGVDEAVIVEDMDFVKGLVRGFQDCEAARAVNRGSKKEKLLQPPQLPPAHVQRDSTSSTTTPPPILHPLLPSRGTPPPRASPSPANAPSLVTPRFPLRAPPPPPPPPPAPPPAPPSRPISVAAYAPPPPPPRPVGLPVIPAPPPLPRGSGRVIGMSTSMPPVHGDLLTSIQAKSVRSLRKTDGPLPAPFPAALASGSNSSGSGVAGGGI